MPFNSQRFRKQLGKFTCTQPVRDDSEEEELIRSVTCKVLTMGDGFVGKTSLLTRFSTDHFTGDYEATIFENLARPVMVGKRKQVMLHLFDTAGQEGYEQLRRSMYYETDVVLLCFSVDSPQSLANIQEKWHPEIRTCLKKVPVLLIGLKTDLRTASTSGSSGTSTGSNPPDSTSPEVTATLAPEPKRRTLSDIANGNAGGSDVETTADSDFGGEEEGRGFSTYSQGQEMANAIGARAYFECSSKLNVGLTAIFDQAARIHDRRQRGSLSLSSLRNRLSSRTSLSNM